MNQSNSFLDKIVAEFKSLQSKWDFDETIGQEQLYTRVDFARSFGHNYYEIIIDYGRFQLCKELIDSLTSQQINE